jgi:hypothetical protein
MPGKIALLTATLVFSACRPGIAGAETLQEALQAANVPALQFSTSELTGKITSYAVANGDPFLQAYFNDDGSGLLPPVLYVVRYDRRSAVVERAELRGIKALFQGEIPIDCLGSALAIREYRSTIYIDTHYNPSAGCVIVLSSALAYKAALSGWLVGWLGDDYAIVRASEVHFLSVHPMHIDVFDLKRNRLVRVFPFEGDEQRRQFSRLLEPHIAMKWCAENNAQCDSGNFDADLNGKIAVNEAAGVFGFEAHFDATGFGPSAERQVLPRNVAYFFQARGGVWEHKEFSSSEFRRAFPGRTIEDLVSKAPNLIFGGTSTKGVPALRQ